MELEEERAIILRMTGNERATVLEDSGRFDPRIKISNLHFALFSGKGSPSTFLLIDLK